MIRASDGRIAGVILAGGQATRMGGGDKGLRTISGRPMIGHVIARLAPQVDAMAINANGVPDRWAAFGLPVFADGVSGFQGPLAGILAGMHWAAKNGFSAVATVAADTPFFPRTLVQGLRDAAGEPGVCLATSLDEGGQMQTHPTFGLWPVSLHDDLATALAAGHRKVSVWADRQKAGRAFFAGPADPFFNVNTPEDLKQAETMAQLFE